MKLKNILKNIEFKLMQGELNLDVNNIQYDSRKIGKGDVFFCIKGFNVDGHKFINNAVKQGASVIVCEDKPQSIPQCTVIQVKDTRKALARGASNFYGNPSEKMKVIGITGTNGKTTSAFMLKSILEQCGHKVGLIGTIANYIGDKKIHSVRTTPESLELQKLFYDMVQNNVQYCVMEVSSHSLSLDRVFGVNFHRAIFTNLTQDHLDFHKTFENYYNAKLKLFKNCSTAIINIDDKYGKRVYEDVDNNKMTYGIDNEADIVARNIEIHSKGIDFEICYENKTEKINLSIPGKYNVYNSLGIIAACLSENISLEDIKIGLKKLQVPGRCEIVTKNYQLGFDVIVDYAHTPDGLENILKTAREFTKGKLISVFGCGGDRDKTKRPIMGDIGSKLSDIAIVTSDNPRTEDPMSIIQDVISGIKKDNYVTIENRKEAIKKAMKIAQKGDVVVVAGKGHEDYQILKDKTIHFDEREIVSELIKELF
ncbi:UDP-N-acetylmuramoyl-L-alanyl-D-glutamate--2,6-diaminopimelate ligase [Haloimpatiens sp. FM7330]|uniref:UDP-N-acetylmuramoyl-L-alanyl-D-glutamate--2, 6-diaminopimelate ligase n=1 Tax=Haloimpatiens sp. FM7330 TaxID=3298610 RepID=UPI00362E85AB